MENNQCFCLFVCLFFHFRMPPASRLYYLQIVSQNGNIDFEMDSDRSDACEMNHSSDDMWTLCQQNQVI